MSRKIIVTSSSPTTNGDLHIGHLSGPFLAADVYTRAQKLFGHQPIYVCSSDDNQCYAVKKAHDENRSVEETVDDYSNRIRTTLRLGQIEMSEFTRPNREAHIKHTQEMFLHLFHKGKLRVVEADSCYCETCETFLFEALVRGLCPHCEQPSGGNSCEPCGQPNDPIDLIDAVCTVCGSKPTVRKEKKILFPLEEYRADLENFYATRLDNWQPHLQQFIREMLAKELPSITLTNKIHWGIPVPLPEFDGHIINSWFEMMTGHIETTLVWERNQDQPNEWWKDPEVELVQFFGYDNSFYYAVFYPALLIAAEAYILPTHFVINEFFLLENQKFSTSRKHAIWGNDFLAEQESDFVRYHLCLHAPEEEQTNFSYAEYEATVEQKMKRTLLPFLQRAFALVTDAAFDTEADVTRAADAVYLVALYEEKFRTYYGTLTFSRNRAAAAFEQFLAEAVQLLAGQPSQAVALTLLQALAVFAMPMLPKFGANLWRALGGDGPEELRFADLRREAHVETAWISEVLAQFAEHSSMTY